MKTRTCTKCKKELPLEMFSKQKSGKNGLRSICKACISRYQKKYRKTKKKIKQNDMTSKSIMDDWTEWHELPPEVIAAMSEKENRKYCEWWCKAHPLDLSKVAKSLLAAMQNVMDDFEHDNAEYMK